jgi:hypothetical protein
MRNPLSYSTEIIISGDNKITENLQCHNTIVGTMYYYYSTIGRYYVYFNTIHHSTMSIFMSSGVMIKFTPIRFNNFAAGS